MSLSKQILGLFLMLMVGTAAADGVLLDGPFERIDLSAHVAILEDPSGELSFAEVVDAEFRASDTAFLYMGFTRSTYWLRFQLHNTGAQPLDTVLAITQPFLDRVEFYQPDGNGGYRQRFSGESLKHKGDDGDLTPAFQLSLAPGARDTYYLRINTVDSMLVPLALYERERYERDTRLVWLFYGISFGALMAVIFYNLFLYLTTRDRSSGYYVLYISAYLVVLLDFDGFLTRYLWPGSMWWADRFHVIGSTTMAVLSLLFIQSFLSTRTALPRFHRIINAYLVFGAVYVLGSLLWDDYAQIMQGLVASSLFFPALAIAAGYARLRQGERAARFFLLAWCFGGLSVLIYLCMHLGLLPSSSFWVMHAMDIGVVIESILFSLAIADQMDQHRRDKERIEREAKEHLALMVEERTAELNAARLEAEQLANTDMLTQLNNRRAFYAIGEVLVQNSQRYRRPVSVLMLDIDYFKAVNDRYGHAVGDEVLRATARVLLEQVRDADVVGRLGGEEFAILLPETRLEEAAILAERIRQAIARLRVSCGEASVTLTASLGVAECMPGCVALDVLIAEADGALYEAKAQGRDRVVMTSSGDRLSTAS